MIGGIGAYSSRFLIKGFVKAEVIVIRFDGGCRPTNPGNKYGSYQVELNGQVVHRVSRMELGWGTNNEAEFEALLAGLEWTRNELDRGGFRREQFFIQMFSDSQIVVNRINGRNRRNNGEPQQRMGLRTEMCWEQLDGFYGYSIHWNKRDMNVALFGH